jgi:hypothetical protein
MRGPEGAERHHVEVALEALEFGRLAVRPVVPAVRRVMSGDLARLEIQNVESFLRGGLRNVEYRERILLGKNRLVRNLDGALNRRHRRAERLRLLQEGIELARPGGGKWERRHQRKQCRRQRSTQVRPHRNLSFWPKTS